MKPRELEKVMFAKPALHRYRYMAKRLIEACQLIIKKYNGNAKNIWKNSSSAKELEMKFKEFKQIGQKKASMAVNILVRDFNLPIKDKSEIDVSNDIHVRRVFFRAGLIEKDEEKELINVARKLNPEYPGILDRPAWYIGMKWCRPTNPDCKNCYLNKVCAKRF